MTARQSLRFAWAVGDVEDSDASFAMDVFEKAAHFLMQFFVEGGKRFIETKDGGAMGEGATECDALGFAAAEFVRRTIEEIGDAEQLGKFVHALGDLGLRLFAEHKRKSQLLTHYHGGKQRAILRHIAHATLGGRESGDLHISKVNASVLDGAQTANGLKDGGFSATTATHEYTVLTGGQSEIHTAQFKAALPQ